MPRSQKAEPFETPERSTIKGTTQMHVSAMEQSNEEVVWVQAGMRHMLVRMVGRRSGEARKVALPFWEDENEHPIVVASYAGAARHPGWYLNLADRRANPEVYCRFREHEFWAVAEVLEGDEYETVWKQLTEDRPFYRDYQALTERRIPLVRLRETRPA